MSIYQPMSIAMFERSAKNGCIERLLFGERKLTMQSRSIAVEFLVLQTNLKYILLLVNKVMHGLL